MRKACKMHVRDNISNLLKKYLKNIYYLLKLKKNKIIFKYYII